MALELFSLFEATEVAQGRVDVQQLSRFRADLAALDARPGEDQGDPRPIVPEGVFSGDELLADVPAVVRPEHHDGVLVEAIALQGLEDASHLAVNETGGGEVGPYQVAPLVGFLQELQADLRNCLLYTSDDADESLAVDLGGRRIIKKK